MKPEVLALITARGGSKGLPRKNILPIAGKPLIVWTVAAALGSRSCTRTVLSTDCEEIRAAATTAGAEAPFLRPADLAGDSTPGIDPVLHAVKWLADVQSYVPDLVVLLQPTSPLRTGADIDAAVELVKGDVDAAVSVTPVSKHPNWMKTLSPEGLLVDYIPNSRQAAQRQELSEVYALNGAVYAIKCGVLLATKSFFPPKTKGYVMPPERSLDIDNAWDLKIAELILLNGVGS